MNHCYFHSSQEAQFTCRHCQKWICRNCSILVEGEPYCQICWDFFVSRLEPSPSESRIETGDIPWQHRDRLGVIQAYIETVKMVALQPARFFTNMPSQSDWLPPILFALICILLFWFPMKVFYLKYVLPPIVQNMFDAEQAGGDSDASTTLVDPERQKRYEKFTRFTFNQVLYLPLDYLLFNVIVASMLQQLLVNLFQGRKGYSATLQIRCYAMALQCLYLIPFLGILLAEFFSLLLCTR